MSIILEALKKAEQERNRGRAPDLQTVHTLPEPPQRRFWPWIITATLLINAAMLGLLLVWFDAKEEPRNKALSVVDETPQQANPATTTTTLNDTSPTTVAALPSPTLTPAPKLTTPDPKLTINESLLPRTSAQASVAETDWSPMEIPATATAEFIEPEIPSFATDERVIIASEPLTEEALPLPLVAMPADFRNALPTLNLDIHVYSAQPERSFVLINAKRYQQGEWLDEGPLLETITVDGVILSFLDQRFMLNVQR